MYNLSSNAVGANLCLTNTTVSAGTTTTITTGAIALVSIGGLLVSKAAAANGASPTTDYATGKAFIPLKANQACTLVVAVDAAGALKVCQGAVAENLGTGTNLQLPSVPETATPIAYTIAKSIGTLVGTWTPCSNNWAGVTGLTTETFVNVCQLPVGPVKTA